MTILLFPALAFAVFLAAYALTFIVNGATPEELAQVMMDLLRRIGSTVGGAAAQVGLG